MFSWHFAKYGRKFSEMRSPWKYMLWRWLLPFASIADGIINLLTLTFVHSPFRHMCSFYIAYYSINPQEVEQARQEVELEELEIVDISAEEADPLS